MKLAIIIQARTNSKRLPEKVLKKIGNKTVLEHLITRLKKLKPYKNIIISTSRNKNDKKIINISKNLKCKYFLGNEKNVLERFYFTAKKFKIKNIIRISADSPFIDPKIVNKAIRLFNSGKYDVVTNLLNPTYPKGMSVEILNFNTLHISYLCAQRSDEKEHVTKFIYENLERFKIKNFALKRSLRNYNFALDTIKDLNYLRRVFKNIKKNKDFYLKDLIKVASSLN